MCWINHVLMLHPLVKDDKAHIQKHILTSTHIHIYTNIHWHNKKYRICNCYIGESRQPKLYWYADKRWGIHFQAIAVIDVPLPYLYILSSDIYTEHKLAQTMAQMLLSLSLSSLIRLYKQTYERSEQILLHSTFTVHAAALSGADAQSIFNYIDNVWI